MQNLTVTLVQTELAWENIEENILKFDVIVDSIQNNTDIIILPEMFTTGFSMRPQELFQDMNGTAVSWLIEKSRDKKADIIGSIIIKENTKYFNRLLWVKPNGQINIYDKKHLFRHAGENKVYSPGEKNIAVKINGWKIRPFICYDLRFPMWTRNINNEYDAAIFIANWPESRSNHWKALLVARAIENQCYVIGVNRVGSDGNGINYSGDSSVISPKGEIIFQKSNKKLTETLELSYSDLIKYRKNFPAWKDADVDIIR